MQASTEDKVGHAIRAFHFRVHYPTVLFDCRLNLLTSFNAAIDEVWNLLPMAGAEPLPFVLVDGGTLRWRILIGQPHADQDEAALLNLVLVFDEIYQWGLMVSTFLKTMTKFKAPPDK